MNWNTTPAPKDGRPVIVADYGTEVDEINPPAMVLCHKDGVWSDGCLCIGDASTDFPLWLDNPPPPSGDSLNGWFDAKTTPPPKDGTWLMLLCIHEGKPYHMIRSWQDNWAASDLGLDGVWSDGLLGALKVEPDYWMPIPEKPPAPPNQTSEPS